MVLVICCLLSLSQSMDALTRSMAEVQRPFLSQLVQSAAPGGLAVAAMIADLFPAWLSGSKVKPGGAALSRKWSRRVQQLLEHNTSTF